MSQKWVLFLWRVFESTNSWKSKSTNIFLLSSPESSLINCTLAEYCSWWVVPRRFHIFEASNWSVRSTWRDNTYYTAHCRMRTSRSCTLNIAVRSSLFASSARFHCEQNTNNAKGFLHSNSHCSPSSARFRISQRVRKPIVLAILCRKVHKIEKKTGSRTGARHQRPFRSATGIN